MYTNLNMFGCGDCGGETYKLYRQGKDIKKIFVECLGCKSISIIEITQPELRISFGEGSTGRIAVY